MFNQSPLETLASYAITFAAGAVAICLVVTYGNWMKTKNLKISTDGQS